MNYDPLNMVGSLWVFRDCPSNGTRSKTLCQWQYIYAGPGLVNKFAVFFPLNEPAQTIDLYSSPKICTLMNGEIGLKNSIYSNLSYTFRLLSSTIITSE